MERDGVNLWRQIGITLAEEIDSGVLTPGGRVPAALELAARFGVNRNTVLRALSHLQDEGLIRIERGRGAFVVEDLIPYRMGALTRFEENLLGLDRVPARELVSLLEMPAPQHVAEALAIGIGETVTLACLLGIADGIPVSYGFNYFPSGRLPGIHAAFASAGRHSERLSVTACLKSVGLNEFRRKSIRVKSRQPTSDEARHLKMAPSESVMELFAINVGPDDVPVIYASTCFCSSRVELVLDMD